MWKYSCPHTSLIFSHFQAHIKFPVDYPYCPPTFHFLTKMWHPNIYEVMYTTLYVCLDFMWFMSLWAIVGLAVESNLLLVYRMGKCVSPSFTPLLTTPGAESCPLRDGIPPRMSGKTPGLRSGWNKPSKHLSERTGNCSEQPVEEHCNDSGSEGGCAVWCWTSLTISSNTPLVSLSHTQRSEVSSTKL